MKAEIKGGKLVIEIDVHEPTPSASGKTLVVASTQGNEVWGYDNAQKAAKKGVK